MKKKQPTDAIVNRRARYDYELGDDLVVGMALSGPEVRAARDSHVQLKGSYVSVKDGELWLLNASFSVKATQPGQANEHTVSLTPRKLLAHKKQIEKLEESKKTGLTIVPTKLLNKGRHIKLVIALGKGKKNYDKRQAIKKRDADRENKRILKI